MVSTRSTFTSLLALISALSAAEAQWSYKTTQDGQYRLGRNGSNLSAEVRTMIVTFRVPSDWHVSACTDEPMDCLFSAGSSPNGLSLAFSLDRGFRKESLSQEYRSYLDGIHAHADPKVQMRAEAAFRLPDG